MSETYVPILSRGTTLQRTRAPRIGARCLSPERAGHPFHQARLARGLSTVAVGRFLGVSHNAVEHWVAGRYPFPLHHAPRLALLFEVDPAEVRTWFRGR